MLAEAAFMVLPLIVCFIYIPWDNDPMKAVWAFVISIAALVVCGVLFGIKAPRDGEIFARDGLAIVSLSWIVMSLFGALPFTISGATATYVDSVFETVSGFTTTGASILTGDVIESLGHGILFWRSFTHLMGGMGVLVFVMAILPMSGARNMHIMRAEVPGPEVGKLVSKIGKTAKILYAIYLVITLIETVVLMICGMEPFDALIHSFGTAGTGGFSNRAASIGYYANPAIHVSISISMLIFGVNFNIYYLVLLKQFKKAFDNLELKVYLAIVGVSTAIVTANIIRQIGSFGKSLKLSFFQVSSLITTTGYATYDFNTWPNLSKAIVILLMFFGATAGSTGGGFKLSRIIILVKSAIREMKKLIHPHAVSPVRMDKKSVDEATVHGTFVYFVVYASVLLVSFFLLSIDLYPRTRQRRSRLCCRVSTTSVRDSTKSAPPKTSPSSRSRPRFCLPWICSSDGSRSSRCSCSSLPECGREDVPCRRPGLQRYTPRTTSAWENKTAKQKDHHIFRVMIFFRYNSTSIFRSISIESGVTAQSTATTFTPARRASLNASPKAGSVASFGRNSRGPFICTTNRTQASNPSFTAAARPRRCFKPRSVGASGNMATPPCSSVTPLTSMNAFFPPYSAQKSNLESPCFTSPRTVAPFGRRPPPRSHWPAALFGAWESILTRIGSVSPRSFITATRSYFVTLS